METRVSPSISRPIPFASLFAVVTFALAPLAFTLSYPRLAFAQNANQAASQPSPQSQASPDPQPAESPAAATTVKVKVGLVVVPVVVRDSSGHAVGTLHKEDFELFDNRKPEEITQFTVENAKPDSLSGPQTASVSSFLIPSAFTALLFDDLNSTFQNLPQLQAASLQLLSTALGRSERLGIFTSSGKLTVDFTDDRAKLQDAISRLKPHPLPGTMPTSCPTITYYDANQIVNRHDLAAREAAVSELMTQCGIKDPRMALSMVLATAERELAAGNQQTSNVLATLSDLIGHISTLRGRRTIVLCSPSFLISDREHREYQLVERALRSHVVISALDSRGLYTDENDVFDSNVLSEFADSTGGTFFHNNNDLAAGLRRAVAPPEFVYQLGFSPASLVEDGRFHHLQVKLIAPNKFSVSAREGYFAPTHPVDIAQAENKEISDALFSSNEIRNLPVQVHTQFARGQKPTATVLVQALVDLRFLPFRQIKDKNTNELRMVAAVFDRNGKYMGAIDRKIGVHWSPAEAKTMPSTDFSFMLDPGNYVVRLVVRDTESQRLYAQDTLVEIP